MTERKFVFATNNSHKLREVCQMLGGDFTVLSLQDIGCAEDIPETGSSFRENASLKSRYVYERYGLDCFADDSGLEVFALQGRPGIYSARYAGSPPDDEANMAKLLAELEGAASRKARFVTVISLIMGGNEHYFEGSVEGSIRLEKSGSEGFGYDPLFEPEGYGKTFAEMSAEEKNKISHRARALEQLKAFLT